MLRRKFSTTIERFLKEEPNKIVLINGARQIGKTFIIRHVGKQLFKHFIEINLKEDKEGPQVFAHVRSCADLYMQLASLTNKKLGDSTDTLIFLDEIQAYPHLLTMLKFLNQEKRYRYIASGSQLGVALQETPSVPIGSISIREMYPLDFEEFLWATSCGEEVIAHMKECFGNGQALSPALHKLILERFKHYMLIGGLPEAVNAYLTDKHVQRVTMIHKEIHSLYGIDASQYDIERKLKIRRIYDLIPSNLENTKKRVVFNKIEDKKWKKYSDYLDEFEYLTASGITLEVRAISNPRFPLVASEKKNLLKLYLNDVGMLSTLLYGNNVNAVLQDLKSINLGNLYESVVAQELHAHGFGLYYFDSKKVGEVDFIVDDYNTLSVLPIEVKSGKDSNKHSALNRLIATPDFNISKAYVLSNNGDVTTNNNITYMPIYYIMFFSPSAAPSLSELPPLKSI